MLTDWWLNARRAFEAYPEVADECDISAAAVGAVLMLVGLVEIVRLV